MISKATNKYLVIDTETGGIIPEKHSLLSIGMVVWDVGHGIIDKKEILIKHKRYVVTSKAKEINKFDRKAYNQLGISADTVVDDVLAFLNKNFEENIAIPVIGHNVQFDVNFLKAFFKKNKRSFNQYFSHRTIDTYSVFKTLVLAGKINTPLDSSADAFKYFGIKVQGRHSALGDALATLELYQKLIEVIKN